MVSSNRSYFVIVIIDIVISIKRLQVLTNFKKQGQFAHSYMGSSIPIW